MDLGDSASLLEWHGPCVCTSFGHRHDHRWYPCLQVSTGTSEVTGVTDITIDYHGCVRAMKPDMALASNAGPNSTMALGGEQDTHISWFFIHIVSLELSLS